MLNLNLPTPLYHIVSPQQWKSTCSLPAV